MCGRFFLGVIDMKKFLLAVILMLSLSSFACAEPARNLATSVDEFCWKYFAILDRNENIFYSPYGINAALSILANGARGDTQKEILQALEADNVQALNEGHKNFSELLTKNYGGDNFFMESNLLLIDKTIFGRGLDKNFKSVATDVYKSDVQMADFSGNLDGEKEKISHWVSNKTAGFIPDYKPIVKADAITDLLNVVYFKGKWSMPFEARGTRDMEFKNKNGSTATVKMMGKVFEDNLKYFANDKFCAIELPYSAGAAMCLILPVDKNSLNVAELWNEESPSTRADFLKGLKKSSVFNGEVIVSLPKFELDIENNLVENLKAMGLQKSFSADAEFFNIINNMQLKIDDAKHRAKVKVDENGTEAAAVTEVEINATAVFNPQPPPRVYFTADRPFLFVIRDVESDVTLFAGVVNHL